MALLLLQHTLDVAVQSLLPGLNHGIFPVFGGEDNLIEDLSIGSHRKLTDLQGYGFYERPEVHSRIHG